MEQEDMFQDKTPEDNPNAPKDYWEMFKSSILDQAKDYPDPVPVINLIQNGNTISLLTLKSYSLWDGKQKSRKTTVLAMAIAVYISQNSSLEDIRFERIGEVGKVLFIDTEQGESYAARTMQLVLKMAGLVSSENLIFCDFRGSTPQDRLQMIHAAMDNITGIKIVVIDGVVDLMEDFQDSKEGHVLITDLVGICSKHNVHVAGVLHQNRTDENARSFVGLISLQKCEMEISCKKDTKDRTQSIVECRESRGWFFEPFIIKRDKDQLPFIVQKIVKGTKGISDDSKKKALDVDSLTHQEHKELVDEIFKDTTEYNKGQLKDAIIAALKKREEITDATARLFVEHWEGQKLIVCSSGGHNAKLYRLVVPEGEAS